MDELRRRMAGGEYLGAYRLARDMLEAPAGLTDHDACEVARIGASAAAALKRWHEAAQMAGRERYWAESADDQDLVAVAAYHHGSVLQYLGDPAMALERLEEFVAADCPPRPALDRFRPSAWFNLGLVHNQRKHYGDAVAAFMTARAAAEAAGDFAMATLAILEAAWSELLDGRTEAAGFRLEEAGILLLDRPDPELQATLLCHQAFYHQRLGETRRAVDLCEEILAPRREGVDDHRRAEAAWIAGECALTVHQLEAAERFAGLALQESLSARWPPLMNQASDLRRRVIEARNRTA